jgi:hypothetical protein
METIGANELAHLTNVNSNVFDWVMGAPLPGNAGKWSVTCFGGSAWLTGTSGCQLCRMATLFDVLTLCRARSANWLPI